MEENVCMEWTTLPYCLEKGNAWDNLEWSHQFEYFLSDRVVKLSFLCLWGQGFIVGWTPLSKFLSSTQLSYPPTPPPKKKIKILKIPARANHKNDREHQSVGFIESRCGWIFFDVAWTFTPLNTLPKYDVIFPVYMIIMAMVKETSRDKIRQTLKTKNFASDSRHAPWPWERCSVWIPSPQTMTAKHSPLKRKRKSTTHFSRLDMMFTRIQAWPFATGTLPRPPNFQSLNIRDINKLYGLPDEVPPSIFSLLETKRVFSLYLACENKGRQT